MVVLTKITNGHFRNMPIFRLVPFIFLALFFSLNVHAGNSWRISTIEQSSVAITPKHGMILKMRKPNKGLWGKLYINVDNQQIENLQKHRLDKYFSFISVGLEVDGYTRNANAKVVETKGFVRIDIDQRMWEGFKKGSKLIVYLPDGSEYTETLRGSSKALRHLEKSFFKR